jgi:hypothetical protein
MTPILLSRNFSEYQPTSIHLGILFFLLYLTALTHILLFPWPRRDRRNQMKFKLGFTDNKHALWTWKILLEAHYARWVYILEEFPLRHFITKAIIWKHSLSWDLEFCVVSWNIHLKKHSPDLQLLIHTI